MKTLEGDIFPKNSYNCGNVRAEIGSHPDLAPKSMLLFLLLLKLLIYSLYRPISPSSPPSILSHRSSPHSTFPVSFEKGKPRSGHHPSSCCSCRFSLSQYVSQNSSLPQAAPQRRRASNRPTPRKEPVSAPKTLIGRHSEDAHRVRFWRLRLSSSPWPPKFVLASGARSNDATTLTREDGGGARGLGWETVG